eukprot:ANDGO_01872.mRNA.1 hypothetical protein
MLPANVDFGANLPVFFRPVQIPRIICVVSVLLLGLLQILYWFFGANQESQFPLVSTTGQLYPASAIFQIASAVIAFLYTLQVWILYGIFGYLLRNRQSICLAEAGVGSRKLMEFWIDVHDHFERFQHLNTAQLGAGWFSCFCAVCLATLSLEFDSTMHGLTAVAFFFGFLLHSVLVILLIFACFERVSHDRLIVGSNPTYTVVKRKAARHRDRSNNASGSHSAEEPDLEDSADANRSIHKRDVLFPTFPPYHSEDAEHVRRNGKYQAVVLLVMFLSVLTYVVVLPALQPADCPGRKPEDCPVLHNVRSATEYLSLIAFVVLIASYNRILTPWSLTVVSSHWVEEQVHVKSQRLFVSNRLSHILADANSLHHPQLSLIQRKPSYSTFRPFSTFVGPSLDRGGSTSSGTSRHLTTSSRSHSLDLGSQVHRILPRGH